MANRPSRPFFFFILGLTGIGFFIFFSASLGLLSREGAAFSTIVIKQFSFLVLGLTAMIIASKVPYRYWRRYSTWIFLAALVASALVFIPGIGFASGGAQRWLRLGMLSFQPSEFLKLATVVYLAAWLSRRKTPLESIHFGVTPFILIFSLPALLLALQPDFDTLMVMFAAGVGMLVIRGVRWRHILIVVLLLGLSGVAIGYTKSHVRERVENFFATRNDPAQSDPQGSGWQLSQSLIAIGSGGVWGRGLGQSLQKFKYLPEPVGDSIFSVASEEFGNIGSLAIVLLFVIFALWSLRISTRSPDQFGRLLGSGIVIIIISGAFTNIASMLGLIPLAGTTLPFVSQGGTALFFALMESGIILNLSKYRT